MATHRREAPRERPGPPRGRGRHRHHPPRPAADERPQRRDPARPDRGVPGGRRAPRRSAVIVWGGEKVFAAGADIKEMETMSYTDMVDHSALLQGFTRPWPASPSRPWPPSPATRSAAGARSRSPATSASRPTTRGSVSPRSCSASSPEPAAPSGSPAWSGRRRPRTSCSRGRFVKADEALAIGLVDEVVPAAEVYAAAAPGWRRTSAARPSRCARPRRPSTAAWRSRVNLRSGRFRR